MTHIELIEIILDEYKMEFHDDPVDDEKVKAFREGLLFGYKYLIQVLKDGGFPYLSKPEKLF